MSGSRSPAETSDGGSAGDDPRLAAWEATPLGQAAQWPAALREAASACFASPAPALIWWGPESLTLYNARFAASLGDRQDWALGRPGAAVWPLDWDVIAPVLARLAMPAASLRSATIHLTQPGRRGAPSRSVALTASAILDAAGRPCGVFCVGQESGAEADDERRFAFLLDFETRLRGLHDPNAIRVEAARLLADEFGASRVVYGALAMGEDASPTGERAIDLCPLEDYGPAVADGLKAGEVIRISDAAEDLRTADEATRAALDYLGVAAFMAAPLPAEGHALLVRHSVKRVWTTAEAATLRDAAGRIGAAVARAAAAQARARSEEEFRALAEHLPNPCWMARADGWIYWYNRNWYDYTGTTPDDMQGWGWQSVHDASWLPGILETWRGAIESGSRFEMTFPMRGADGVFRPFLTRIVPVRDEAGNVIRWIGNNVDITEQLDAEERLRVSEAKLRALNETLAQQVEARTAERDRMWRLATDIMLVARFDGTMVSINPAWTDVLGWEEESLLGRSMHELTHPEDATRTREAVSELAAGRRILRFEARYCHRAGGHRLIAWSAVPEDGFIHAVGRDITAETEAAARLEAAQERLRQSQRMEALGQLAGGIAHDFNNVLQSVLGGLGLITTRAGDAPAVRRVASMVIEVAERGAAITGRLLSFGRRSDLQSVPIEPAALLDGLAEMLSHTLGSRITVQTDCAPALPALFADKSQLETVLINLAVNARDAMEEGGVLTIGAHAETVVAAHPAGLAPGTYLRLTIADTGAGMDEATLARAGEPFFTTKPVGQGTGLGLAMARGFSEQSGGGFAISSAPGQGTEVTLWLPRAGTAAGAAAGAAAGPAQVAGIRALIVDDDEIVRLVLAERLEEAGWLVSQAADGQEALGLLSGETAFDLLVTDYSMPGMTGLALIAAARDRRAKLPAILLTGYADAGVRDAMAGETVLLRKPVSPDELAERAASMVR